MSLSRPLLVVAACALAAVAARPAQADRYSEAVAHEGRPAGDLKRDETDHPAEILRLAGIRSGMTVVDFLAADGYYSELASYLVGPRGHVYLLNNDAYDRWSNNEWEGRLGNHRLPNVEHRAIVVEQLGLPARSVDAMLVIKVYHDLFWKPDNGPWPKNIDPDAVLTEMARVMRPGGILLLVDHSAKADSGSQDAGSLHRIDEQYARRDFEKHGFELVRRSDVLRHADDPRDMITYKGEMFGKTDRFVMVFRKRSAPPHAPAHKPGH